MERLRVKKKKPWNIKQSYWEKYSKISEEVIREDKSKKLTPRKNWLAIDDIIFNSQG
jgi:hypothetical protein